MERFPYDLLLHVLCLQQNTLDSLITDNYSKSLVCVWLIDSLHRESIIIYSYIFCFYIELADRVVQRCGLESTQVTVLMTCK